MVNLQELLDGSGFTASEVKQMTKNPYQVVKGVLESTNERELAARFGVVVRKDEISRERLHEVFITSSKKMDVDPNIRQMGHLLVEEESAAADFSSLELEPNGSSMTKAYLAAKPGDSLNLSKQEIESFAALSKQGKKSQAHVEAQLRGQLAARLAEYQKHGLAGMSPYARTSSKNYSPGDELKLKTGKAVYLEKASPAFYKYLLEYPTAPKPDGLEESFSWINFTIDDKPTYALIHKLCLVMDDNDDLVLLFCQRHFYVSRGHNSLQGIGGSFGSGSAGDNNTFTLVYGSRTSTDQVTGFGGSAKRSIGARIMGGRIAENMERVCTEMAKK